MNVLLCTLAAPWPDRPSLGRYNVDLAAALGRAGHETSILAAAPPIPKGFGTMPGSIGRQARRSGRYTVGGVDIRCARIPFAYPPWVRTRVAAASPATLARVFALAAARVVEAEARSRGAGAILAHGVMPWGEAIRGAARRIGIPFAFIEHSWDDVEAAGASRRRRRWQRRITGDARAVMTVSRPLRAMIESVIGDQVGVPIVPNGVPEPLLVLDRDDLPAPSGGARRFLCIGSFVPRKRHRLLLEAFAAMDATDTELTIVGTPPPDLEASIARLGCVERVNLRPEVPRDEIGPLMRAHDVFVLPSRREAFGLVYAEAMAVGTPVILTSESGIAGELESGVHGWVVPPDDRCALTRALDDAAACDTAVLRRMGASGSELVRRRFRWAHAAEVVAATFEN